MQAIITLDLHHCTAAEAVEKAEHALQQADRTVYRIRLVHGFNRGTRVREAILRELGYGLQPKILRIIPGENEGITELVLREY